MSSQDNVDANKVNAVLKEFEASLKKYQPNLPELALITKKINELYQRNVRKRMYVRQRSTNRNRPDVVSTKKWRKIKIE